MSYNFNCYILAVVVLCPYCGTYTTLLSILKSVWLKISSFFIRLGKQIINASPLVVIFPKSEVTKSENNIPGQLMAVS